MFDFSRGWPKADLRVPGTKSGVTLVERVAAFVLLAAMHLRVTWSSVRSQRFRKWSKDEPGILLRDGEFGEAVLRDERVTRQVMAAVRGQGYSAASQLDTVTFETDGSTSVIPTHTSKENA